MALLIAKSHNVKLVKDMIHERLCGWEKPRPHGTIHASELMKELEFCPREWALLDLNKGKKKDQFVGTALRLTFDHGRSIEKAMRNDWLRDVAVGSWRCTVCGSKHPHFGKEPKVSCSCGYKSWEYEEARFASPLSGVSGGLDLFIDMGEPKLRIVEIKTMDKDEFKKLEAPLAEHKFRTSLYMQLADESADGISQRVNTSYSTLLYVSKSFGFKDLTLREAGIKDSPFSPFKEFIIKRDDSITKTPVAKATVLHRWRLGGMKGMPCGVCQSGLTKRAQQCSSVGACFSGAHPATLTWMEAGVPRHPGKTVIG